MNILILVRSYPPVTTSAARLYSELSESLAEMGHNVTVVTSHPAEDDILIEEHKWYDTKLSEKINGVNVLRVPSLAFLSKIPGGKPCRFLFSCFLFALRGFFTNSPDIILVYSPPIFMGVSGYIFSKLKKSKFVFNLQDIHPKVLFDTGVVKSSIFKKMLSKMEEISYRKACSFIVYSNGNSAYLYERGVERDIFIIPNWVDIPTTVLSDGKHLFPGEKRVDGKFVVSYAGSMQQAQGLEVVVETADALRQHDGIVFMMAGEGSSKPILKSLIADRKLENFLLSPVMPKERYFQFLNACDVCLVTLNADVPLHTVPGKLSEIMACGKPIIAAVNGRGDAAGIVKEARCGLCVEPGNAEAFSQAVLTLYRDEGLRKEMGENGRRFAEKNFSRTVCTKQYEEVLLSAIRGGRLIPNND